MSTKAKLESFISTDSRSTLSGEDSESFTPSQTIEITADFVLIKKERVGRNKYGEIFKGERVSMYSELGIQAVLINEMNLDTSPKESVQFIHKRTAAPVFNSPHIAKCYGLYMNPKGSQIWMVTEFLPFSAQDLIESGPFEEQQIAFIIAEVIKGLDYLHSRGIRHGDVTSSQVMLSQAGEVKLSGLHTTNDTLDASQLPGTDDNDFKGDILSLGKMAIELVLGPQVSDEQVVVEKEIPSLLNQFSQHFRSVVMSCLQKDPKYRPTAAQLLNYSLIKKMRKVTALKDHKLLFNRCKRFKRSLTRRKSRNHTPRQLTTAAGQENGASDHHSLGSFTSIQSNTEAHCGALRASDLPNVAWSFGRLSIDINDDLLVQKRHDPIKITFQTVTVTTKERIHRLENDSAEKVFKGTFTDSTHQVTTPCLIREINLSKLSKGAAQKLCHEAAAPLFRTKSPNIVKVLHAGFSGEEGGRDPEGNHSAAEALEQGSRLYIITELFLDSIHSLQELGPLEEDLIAWILREVLKALNYLHSQGIAYGNISTHNILFSIASGSLEIKLDHTHTVIDGLGANAVSQTNFNHKLKADIRNLGVIATELAHIDPPTFDSSSMDFTAPTLTSMYSIHFTDFVISCLEKAEDKRPTAHQLLQCLFIRGAKETCGLESVFDLYWKHKLAKDKLLHNENDNSLFDDEDIQVPPSVSWSFDEPLPSPSDEPEIQLPPPPSLQNIWDQENKTKDELIISEHESATSAHDSISTPRVDQTPSLMDHKQQRTQISVSTPHIAGPDHEMNEYKKAVTATPVTQQLGTDTINSSTSSLPGEQHRIRSRTHPNTNETNTSMSSLPGEHQRVRSRTQHSSTHEMNASASSLSGRNRQPVHPRSSRPTSYVSPPNLQGPAAPAPWWMYPPAPWWLPPPWWLHPQMPTHQPMSPRGGGGQYGYPPQGQWYYSPPPPPPPQWYYPMASTPQQQGPPTPSQVQGRSLQPPLWRYPPSPWQRSQPHLVPQQPPTAVSDESQAQVQQGVSSFEARPVPQQSPYQLPRANPQQQHAVHSYIQSQELPPAVPSTAAADHEGYPPQYELQHKELSSANEQHLTHEEPPVWQPKTDDRPSMEDDPPSSEVPLLHTMNDNQLLPQHEEILTKEEPLVEMASLLHSTVECEEDQLEITEVRPMELMADDNIQVYHEDIVLEAPPMELIVNGLVLEEEAKTETQPMADSLLLQQGEEHLELHSSEILIHHEESLLEAPPMQLTVNDLVPEEEITSEAPLLQPMADSLLQQGEDHPEQHPPQPRLDDIQVQHEQPLLEATPMQLTVNHLVPEEEVKDEVPLLESTTDSLSQDGEDDKILEFHPPQPIADDAQVHHEEPLLEVLPMQPIVSNLVPDEEAKNEVQPAADSLLQQGEDHPELHPPQPRLDDTQVQHEQPLLEASPMQLTLVTEEEAKNEVPHLESTTDSLSQDGEILSLELCPPQPITDNIQVRHEEPLLEAPSMKLEKEIMGEAPLPQPMADNLLQQGEDHLELHPPQPRLDDIQVRHEQPLLEATSMQLIVNDLVPEEEVKSEVPLLESTTDSLSQDGESHKNLSLELCPPQPIHVADNIQVRHEEPLLEVPPMQLTVDAEEEIMSDAALPQPTVDSLPQQGEDHPELHPPQPRLDDIQVQHEQPLLEASPMQLTVNHLVPEEEVTNKVPCLKSITDSLSQDGKNHKNLSLELSPPQPIADNIQVRHEEPLLEAPPMKLTVNDLVPEEEIMSDAALPQPTADSLLQQGEDHPELHPPQPRLDDIQVQHEQPLLEATPMQLTVNHPVPEEEVEGEVPLLESTTDSLSQDGEDDKILVLNPPQPIADDTQMHHEEPLLEVPPIVNNLVPDEEAKSEVQPAADSLLQHATPDDIQGQDDKEPPLHTSSSHSIPNDSHISNDKAKDLLQPIADSQPPLHQDDQISQDELGKIESLSPQLMEKVESNVYTLQELMKPQPLEEHQIATILLKVVQIIDGLHLQGKVHNDVTIANIILSESGEIKLEDCKVPKIVLQMVPEVDQLIEDDQKADIWSLGITAVEIASGEPPDANMLELLFGDSFITPQFLDDDIFSEEFEDFIGYCLKSDPDERSSAQELMEHTFLVSASPDTRAVTDTLITRYKDYKKCQSPSEPAASDLPPEDIDMESQQSAPEYDSRIISHDADISQLSAEPAIDDHPPQHEIITAAEDSLLQPTASNQSLVHEDHQCEQSAAADIDYPPLHDEDQVTEKEEPIIEDSQPQHHRHVAELLPALQSTGDAHSMTAMESQHDEDSAVIVEEAEPVVDDHSPQHQGGLLAELLPVLQSIADTHSVINIEEDPQIEAPLTQSTINDGLLPPLQDPENQLSQEQLQPRNENKYSLQELIKPQPLEEHQIATILLKVVQIIDDLHSQGKVHNDVTIANITLSDSGEIKLEDSKAVESVLQMVPEVDQLIEDDDQKADIWSLGVTAVEIASGEPPDANMLELLFGNSFITPQFLDDEKFSEDFEDFISSCLKSDPEERSSTEELLEHDFLSSATPDVHAVVDNLISQYNDWRT